MRTDNLEKKNWGSWGVKLSCLSIVSSSSSSSGVVVSFPSINTLFYFQRIYYTLLCSYFFTHSGHVTCICINLPCHLILYQLLYLLFVYIAFRS
jgi:hypothetical protein